MIFFFFFFFFFSFFFLSFSSSHSSQCIYSRLISSLLQLLDMQQ
jgi:hypothetical protein